jgi:hypothetical protein
MSAPWVMAENAPLSANNTGLFNGAMNSSSGVFRQ